MKRKIKITSKMVKRAILLVLLVAVVGLLVFVTIESFDKDIVSSNSSNPAECMISGKYKEYIDSFGEDANYPSEFKYSASNNQAIEAEYDEAATEAANIGLVTKTGEGGTFTDTDGVTKNFIYSGREGSVVYNVTIPAGKAGFYNIVLNYVAMDDIDGTGTWEASGGADIERNLLINGAKSFEDFPVLTFVRTWHDGGSSLVDLSGNEIKPAQRELLQSNVSYVRDSVGYVSEPYLFYFEEGDNTITIEAVKENMGILGLYVASKESYESYATYKEAHKNEPIITGNKAVKVEGESAVARSSSTIYAVNDKTSAYTTSIDSTTGDIVNKADPIKLVLNTIGGSKWTTPGSWITWEFEVGESGLYEISLRSKQNVSRGLFSTRKLYIDGEVPFSEAQNCKFVYGSDYNVVTLGTEDEAFLFYFEAGKKHTITLECTLGDYASQINRVQEVIDTLNGLYREIIKKTGISPDPYINYFKNEEGQAFIARATEEFKKCKDTLYEVSDYITQISGEKSSEASSLETMAVQLDQFISSYRKIQKSLGDFSTNISSLGTWILNVSEQALTIDFIEVHTQDYKIKRANPNIFVGGWFKIRGFFGSFFADYESVGLTSGTEGWKEVEVWLLTSESTGREQGNAISSMIYEAQSDAKTNPNNPLYGLNIKLKVVSSSVLLTATLAGRGPDVAINVSNGTAVNYALRGAVHDLSGFEDFDEVSQRFAESAMTPFKYVDTDYETNTLKEGCYALPYTQSYLVMFYRTDMFEEYNWEVPQTWEQVLQLIPELQIMNFQFYLPLNTVGASSVVNQIFASYLYQTVEDPSSAFYRTQNYQDADGINKQYIISNFDSEESMKAFEFWCSFYTDFSFPLAASFVNRFRSGETPIGIAGFDMYNTLAVSAPEIKGKWAFALLPGVEKNMVDANGNQLYVKEHIDVTGKVVTEYVTNPTLDATEVAAGYTIGKASYVDHTGAASGMSLIMMEQPKKYSEEVKNENYEAAWKFMKWFTSADTQVGFAREIEAILGSAARLNTANIEAFDRLAWSVEDLSVLDEQREGQVIYKDGDYEIGWVGTVGVPEVPGGYYTGRNLENAFRFVVNNNENPRQTLTDYILSINNEIDRKRKEFGLGTVSDSKASGSKLIN